ncbi:leucyl aminopeptidase [Ornithinimicrobium sp. INDO-MA30-4]|uniref:leucyl aminopeptidase n=1 Tax=Ornithinimicrobium sp. INDO-MA30-4 TaxID=2908651 RepID=UPI001F3F7974|nr:leucyl aminopeptidase [Ornithinimicrobium sp. INDO-MA30-4]UJH71322.1 leucyl aminopeptidase [Ornithinimicrobium sp. INDO-MA30-4]
MPAVSTTLQLTDKAPGSLAVAVLVVAIEPGKPGPALRQGHGLSSKAGKTIEEHLAAVGAEASLGEVTQVGPVAGVKAERVVAVGVGKPAKDTRGSQRPDDTERYRRAAGSATRSLAGSSDAAVAFGDLDEDALTAVAQGSVLGAYAYQEFFGEGKKASAKAPLGSVTLLGLKARSSEGKKLVAQVSALTSAVNYARDLVNMPPNALFPQSFAESVARNAKKTKVTVDVWDPQRLHDEGCGGILGVGQGSARAPRLVTMKYAPSKPVAHLAFVGKGITFDSGGLCLKPAASMVTMKCDMGGAAAVAAAIFAIEAMGLPIAVTGYLCLAENMTGDLAQRPGDVVTMRGGKTVEIINTDAEGRLVMADGLALASESKPDAIIDIATLTGAAVVALGERTLGIMSNDQALTGRAHASATLAGEPAWPLPMLEEIRSTMDSPVADLKHTGERSAGAMVAATFLAEFVGNGADGEQLPWAHLDIAGPAFNDKAPFGYTPKGGTGAGVRALVELAQSYTLA